MNCGHLPSSSLTLHKNTESLFECADIAISQTETTTPLVFVKGDYNAK